MEHEAGQLKLTAFFSPVAPLSEQEREDAIGKLNWVRGRSFKLVRRVYDRLPNAARQDEEVAVAALRISPTLFETMSAKLRGNRRVAIEAVSKNHYLIEYASDELRDDPEVVMAGAGSDWGETVSLRHASKRLRSDKDFVIRALSTGANLFWVDESIQYDLDVVSAYNCFDRIDWRDVEEDFVLDDATLRELIMITSLRNDHNLDHAPRRFLDMAFFLEFARRMGDWDCGGSWMEHAPKKLQSNRDFAMAAVRKTPLAYAFISKRLQFDREIALVAAEGGIEYEYRIPNALRGDRRIALAAAANDGSAFEYFSARLRDDKDVAMIAVESRPDALEFASKRLRSDGEVVFKAIRSVGAFSFATPRLMADRQFVTMAMHKDPRILKYARELMADKQFVVEAMKLDPYVLYHASAAIQTDRRLALAAVKKEGWLLEFLPHKDDAEIVIAAIRNSATCTVDRFLWKTSFRSDPTVLRIYREEKALRSLPKLCRFLLKRHRQLEDSHVSAQIDEWLIRRGQDPFAKRQRVE